MKRLHPLASAPLAARHRYTASAGPAEEAPSHQEASLIPPRFVIQSKSPETTAPDTVPPAAATLTPEEEAKVQAAQEWATGKGNLGAITIKQVQEALGLPPNGVYDQATVLAVMKMQQAQGLKKSKVDGKANSALLEKLGIILTKPVKEATAGAGVKDHFYSADHKLKDQYKNGISVAFYVQYSGKHKNTEFENQATPWAKKYSAVGLNQSHELTPEIPIPVKSPGQILESIHSIYSALEKVDLAAYNESMQAEIAANGLLTPEEYYAFPKINRLAIFSHGMNYGLGISPESSYTKGLHSGTKGRKSNLESFVKGMADLYAPDIKVLLYACNTGRKLSEDKKTSGLNTDLNHRGGTDSFAGRMAAALGGDSSVYAHLTAGHMTRNPNGVVFGRDAGGVEGIHISNLLYDKPFIDAELAKLAEKFPDVKEEKLRAALMKEVKDHYQLVKKDKRTGKTEYLGIATRTMAEVMGEEGDIGKSYFGAEIFANVPNAKKLVQENWHSTGRLEKVIKALGN